jgi:hypothetical protein
MEEHPLDLAPSLNNVKSYANVPQIIVNPALRPGVVGDDGPGF